VIALLRFAVQHHRQDDNRYRNQHYCPYEPPSGSFPELNFFFAERLCH
jgi:hypothetical protein